MDLQEVLDKISYFFAKTGQKIKNYLKIDSFMD